MARRRKPREIDRSAPGPARMIAVDWGTTSFRAYLIGTDGTVTAAHHAPRGILAIADGRFEDALLEAVAPWIAASGTMPVVLSGMIGSRQGWHEVPYVACPARLADLGGGMHRFTVDRLGSVSIVPGVVERRPGQLPDVMRGEETQVLGALARLGMRDATFVLPGTHSKWVRTTDGTITGFATYMTGEVFAALKDHTILGRLMTSDGPRRGTGFVCGLSVARSDNGGPGALLQRIFSARTLSLVADLAGADIADYLSGLLIGAEVADAMRQQPSVADRQLIIIAGDALAARYATACEHMGVAATMAPADCAATGIAMIARQAGLWGPA